MNNKAFVSLNTDDKSLENWMNDTSKVSPLMQAVFLNEFRVNLMEQKSKETDAEYIKLIEKDLEEVDKLITQLDYELTPTKLVQ